MGDTHCAPGDSVVTGALASECVAFGTVKRGLSVSNVTTPLSTVCESIGLYSQGRRDKADVGVEHCRLQCRQASVVCRWNCRETGTELC